MSVTLHQLDRWRFSVNPSGPCAKLETFLRLAKIDYTIANSMSPGEAGRWPYITYKGKNHCDSWRIMEFLKKEFNVKMDDGLTEDQIATGTYVRRVVEEHMYWCLVRLFWVDNRPFVHKHTPIPVPDILLGLTVAYARRGIIDALNQGSVGDLSVEEYQLELLRDCQCLAALIKKNKPGTYILGTPQPTSYDCVVYSQLSVFNGLTKEGHFFCEAFRFVHEDKGIQDYLKRLEAAAFPDHDAVMAKYRAAPPRNTSIAITTTHLKVVGVAILVGVGYATSAFWMQLVGKK